MMNNSSKFTKYFSQQQSSYPQYIPFNYEYADLEIIMDSEPDSNSPPPRNKGVYLTCVLTTLVLISLAFFFNFSDIEQIYQKVKQKVYNNYLSLINY